MTADTDMLEAQLRCLENENRELRETLRDRFAMAAMQTAFQKMVHNLEADGEKDTIINWDWIAESSYEAADSMLEARK